MPFQVMFERDADCMSVSTMVLDAILASPIDTRRELAANLVVVGGTSMMVGFKARLVEEIKHLLAEVQPYKVRSSRLYSILITKNTSKPI